MRKSCSAPNGDSLKEMHEKESKGRAWNMRIFSILSCASPENSKFNSYSFSISVFSFKISEEVSLLSVVVVAEARSFLFFII